MYLTAILRASVSSLKLVLEDGESVVRECESERERIRFSEKCVKEWESICVCVCVEINEED